MVVKRLNYWRCVDLGVAVAGVSQAAGHGRG